METGESEFRQRLTAILRATRGERIRTFGSAMRWHRRQRGGSVTPPDPGGEWWLLGPPLDNSVGVPKLATARMTGAPVDRPRLGRTHENRCLSSAEPEVRIYLPPAASHTNFEGHRTQARIGLNQSCSGFRFFRIPLRKASAVLRRSSG
jgi:hypothetical protein